MKFIELKKRDAVIYAGKLISVTGSPVTWSPLGCKVQLLEDVLIWTRSGIIERVDKAVEAAAVARAKAEQKNNFVDLSGFCVLPGLIDCHVHLGLGNPSSREIKRRLQKLLACGILAVRDAGDRNCTALEYLKNYFNNDFSNGTGNTCSNINPMTGNACSNINPMVVTTGFALRKSGQYGAFLGRGIPGDGMSIVCGEGSGISSKDGSASGREGIIRVVDELCGKGIDQLKVLESGVVSFKNYGQVGDLQFSLPELKFIVELAHEKGLRTMVHANSAEGVKRAVLAGADSVEHGYFLSEELLELMAERGVFWVPTVVPVAGQLKKSGSKYTPKDSTNEVAEFHEPRQLEKSGKYTPEEISVIRKTYLKHLQMIKKAADAGVRLAVGTDAGAPGVEYGASFYDELLFFAEAGLSNGEIICAATAAGAAVLGRESIASTLEPGKRAAMVAVQGNPLQNLSILKNIDYLIY